MIESLPHEDLTKMCVTLWAIWHAKRKATYEEVFQSPLSTFSFIQSFLNDLETSSRVMKKKAPSSVPLVQQRWIPPPARKMKINVDAATGKNNDLGSVAAVARDEHGGYLGASALVLQGVKDPEVLEAIACREALALASDLNLSNFCVASDCKAVIDNLKGDGFGRYGQVVREVNARAAGFPSAAFLS